MNVTSTALFRTSAVSAVVAGLLFAGVQIGHPHADATTVLTTEWAVRNAIKVLMAATALVGITGMYLRQRLEIGLLGLVGYVVLAIGYLTIMCVTFASAVVLPEVAAASPAYVDDVVRAATGGRAAGDIGAMQAVLAVSGATFLAGGLIFGAAMFRARVLARWASALLALASVLTASLALLPDSFYRLLAYPDSLALVGLGLSLWASARTAGTRQTGASRPAAPAGRPAPARAS